MGERNWRNDIQSVLNLQDEIAEKMAAFIAANPQDQRACNAFREVENKAIPSSKLRLKLMYYGEDGRESGIAELTAILRQIIGHDALTQVGAFLEANDE